MSYMHTFVIALTISLDHVLSVNSHGRLMDPPARNSMWRFGYPNPVNFNDNELYCGGAAVMQSNGGKCGTCGDNYLDGIPRAHEIGGKYGNRIITRNYIVGQIIHISVELTANHLGYFLCKLAGVVNSQVDVTQEKLDRTPLMFVKDDGSLSDKHMITKVTKQTETYNLKVKLPDDMDPCRNCVFQWTYTTGNSWGVCEDGTEQMGCGPQEKFVNCADVQVLEYVPPDDDEYDDLRSLEPSFGRKLSPNILYDQYDENEKQGKALTQIVVKSQVCTGIGKYGVPGIDQWCQDNCMRYPPNCPSNICRCIKECKAVGYFKKKPGADLYCSDNCNVYPQKNCPAHKCKCV